MSENNTVRKAEQNRNDGLIECEMCKTYNYRGSKFCLYCGCDLSRRCSRCGAEAADRLALYCTECGTAFATPLQKQ